METKVLAILQGSLLKLISLGNHIMKLWWNKRVMRFMFEWNVSEILLSICFHCN